MREVTKFVTDDGKEFEDYEYELIQKASTFPAGAFNMFDEKGKHTDNIENAYYIVSNSYHASQYLWELADHYGYEFPYDLSKGKVGRWYYENDRDEWVSFEELEAFYKTTKKIFS